MTRETGLLIGSGACMVAVMALFAIVGQRFIAWYNEWAQRREDAAALEQRESWERTKKQGRAA